MSCPFSNIFGKPNTGVHSYRIFGLAAIDILLTAVMAWLFARYINNYSILINLTLLWLIGVLFHILFCVKTPITEFLQFSKA